MKTEISDQFPELVKPLCKKGKYICGHCMTARDISNGTKFSVEGVRLSMEDAIRYNLQLCRGMTMHEDPPTVQEIRREGQRILKAGVNVKVQLKRKAGTRLSTGHIVDCFDDDTVRVFLDDLGTSKIVPVDEYLVARQGNTSR